MITIRNEAENLPDLLESIRCQSLSPAEIIVVDGGSSDASREILREWAKTLPITVICSPGANISQGRNLGLERASSDIVAVTDAGVRLEPDWLEHLVAPLTQSVRPVDVVGGFFEPDPRSQFETALAAATLPDVSEIQPEQFLPSSRSFALRRSWYQAGVRYPEWLDYCEDVVFDLRLRGAGARFAFQPRAIARFRPRSNIGEFWRQYYRYARGDGRSGLFARRHLARYLTYLVIVPSAILVRSWLWRGLVMIGALAYMWRPILRLKRRTRQRVHTLLPLVALSATQRGIGDFAKMTGYPAGLAWRARRYGLRKNWRTIPEDSRDS